MSEEIPIANDPLSSEEKLAAEKLTEDDFKIIDAAILGNCIDRWYKVARVVSETENKLKSRYASLSCVFYAHRIISLAEHGLLESQGDLDYMRFSEVRLPDKLR